MGPLLDLHRHFNNGVNTVNKSISTIEKWWEHHIQPGLNRSPFPIVHCPHGCFEGTTLVSMADGSLRAISTIKPGDEVLSLDVHSGILVIAQVQQTAITLSTDSVVLRLSNGETIHTTQHHPFYTTTAGFIQAKDLQNGMYTRTKTDTVDKPAVLRHDSIRCRRVYNLEVVGYHTYFVGKAGVPVGDVTQRSLSNR